MVSHGRNGGGGGFVLHFPSDYFILVIAYVFFVGLYDAGDLFLEDSGKFAMVLVVFAEHEYFILIFVLFVISFEIFGVFVKGNGIFELVQGRTVVAVVHVFDLCNPVVLIVMIDCWMLAKEEAVVRLHAELTLIIK